MLRRNVVENNGGLFLEASQEATDTEGSGAGGVPSLGSNLVVEKNVAAESLVYVLVNKDFKKVFKDKIQIGIL